MWRTSSVTPAKTLNQYASVRPVETKETKLRDTLSSRMELDVVIYCLNCQSEYINKDLEELRMFEYAFTYFAAMSYASKQKCSQMQTPANVAPSFPSLTTSQFQPVSSTTSFGLPQPSFGQQAASQPAFQSFNFQSSQQPSSSISLAQPLSTGGSSFTGFGQTSNAGFGQTSNTGFGQTSNTGFGQSSSTGFGISNPFSTSTGFNTTAQPQQQFGSTGFQGLQQFGSQPTQVAVTSTAAPLNQNLQGFSNIWATTPTVQTSQSSLSSAAPSAGPVANVTQTLPPSQPSFPSVYPGLGQPSYQMPYPSYPPFYPPRYPMYYDPYMYPRMPMDTYSFMHRDPSFLDSSRESTQLQKALMQRQAAQALYYKYGIDPSIPVSDSFFDSRDQPITRRSEQDISSRSHSQKAQNEPVIHVVPTLGGIKDGKQQIVLDIEETAENRHYIPKIFNPNAEISFTITSKETSGNKSYLASLIQDTPDTTIPENLSHRSPKSFSKDLPKPILNKRVTPRKKSILDMDLSDYQISSKIEPIPDNSVERRRVTFQEGPTVLGSSESGFLSPQPAVNREFQSPLPIVPTTNQPSPSPRLPIEESPNKKVTPSKQHATVNGLGGSLVSFNDSTAPLLDDSKSLVSKFKWTPSWFISTIVSKFSREQQAEQLPDTVSPPSSLTIKASCGVVLTRYGYYTVPTIDELDQLVVDNHCYVKNFTVGRFNVGKVVFEGETDVYNINLDQTVFINEYEVEVYRDDDPNCIKPPVGSGLNKPARLTLYNVFPKDANGEIIKDLDSESLKDFESYLQRKAQLLDAEFLEYDPRSGSFTFTVSHFTKYNICTIQRSETENLQSLSPKVVDSLPNPTNDLLSRIGAKKAQNCASITPRKSIGLNLKRKCPYLDEFYGLYSNPELCYSRHYINYIGQFALSIVEAESQDGLRNDYMDIRENGVSIHQSITMKKLKYSCSSSNTSVGLDFINSTNIKMLFDSLIKSISFEQRTGYVPTVRFIDPHTILPIYSSFSKLPIFELIRALWTDESTCTLNELDSASVSRKKHLLNWVKSAYGFKARSQSHSYLKNNDVFSAVICLLSANLVEEAVSLLNSTKNFRTAALLSESLHEHFRSPLSHQLDQWLETGLTRHIDNSYIKLMMLMCGKFVIEFEDSVLHVCEGLGWINCLTLFVLFTHQEYSLRDSLELYVKHTHDYHNQISSPYFIPNVSYDIMFHVLKYFSCLEVDTSKMFETNTYTYNPIDYSLSFNVYMIMKMIGDVRLDNESVFITHFSKQLEVLGFWEHAIFVLQFIRCDVTRTQMVSQIIRTHVCELECSLDTLNSLNISKHMLDLEKAIWLLHIGNTFDAVELLLSCGEYEKSHQEAIKQYIPHLFISEQFEKLSKLLTTYDNSEFCADPYYQNNAKVYLTFLEIKNYGYSQYFHDSKAVECLLDVIRKLSQMEVINFYQRLARSIIASHCLDCISNSHHVSRINIEEIASQDMIHSDFIRQYMIGVFDKLE
ncbi:Nuclear pore complex protein Nup98-Nup96 [Thelohanellus kitauei]|uniref:Nuclear pore complex protein Nup98-Nup96 n=1 Tax=Thelohanellus kitauei TaxID=669202 RepID=A0A0C2MCL6_THEKT|nr:Nuclear pore complex protein Nup98-Nup96 [Thelohanellus kitauei]